ncbi:heavy metal translocating P-type ATPase metal-binding domain-containing protein [soil metagenome]
MNSITPEIMESETSEKNACFHCGLSCDHTIRIDKKYFCCNGCKQVYQLLNSTDLCEYYEFDKRSNIRPKGKFINEKFGYLDDEGIQKKLLTFCSGSQHHATFYLPQMHCSSCIWLLENLHKINPAIISSRTNFQKKEVAVIYDPKQTGLRKIVELIAFIGYEPEISLNDASEVVKKPMAKKQIIKIGVAGFCFANIMMLSFPEYFSAGQIDYGLRHTFIYLNLILSLPVFFFSASDFFISAWKGLRQNFLNIDAPISLAIILTFSRSVYEILAGISAGYLDSMSGIVFFMLIGRWFQDKTYSSISFERDYRSYLPLGITVKENNQEKNIPLTQLQKGAHILIQNSCMIPADAVLVSDAANIDYSFVTGENLPVAVKKGETIYAGGKQIGGRIELETIADVSNSRLMQLWNNDAFAKKNQKKSFIHPWSRYFTMALFSVAFCAAAYWLFIDKQMILPAVTSVLIVACPCSLLLSATFTYGNMLLLFSKNNFFLKNSSVIESLSSVDTIVFDKTGTLTRNDFSSVEYDGAELTETDLSELIALTSGSSHPLSKSIRGYVVLKEPTAIKALNVEAYTELAGKGISARINEKEFSLGAPESSDHKISDQYGSEVHLMVDRHFKGKFLIKNHYREGISSLTRMLKNRYDIFLLSGDNDSEKKALLHDFDKKTMLFRQSPQDKLNFIKELQTQGKKVMMVGDGLNDAGALKQADAGIAITEDSGKFSPACDALLDADYIDRLYNFMRFARAGKVIITLSFIISILYNFIGLFFAVQGLLSPMIAAILMPVSSITIVLFVTAATGLYARLYKM